MDVDFILNGDKKPKKQSRDPLMDLFSVRPTRRPDGTGPHGRGLGPGNGKRDGSGMRNILGDHVTKPQRRVLRTRDPMKLFGDWDGDGVINGLDCQPKNKKKHMAIRFSRKPKIYSQEQWANYKSVQDKMTHKNNITIDPRQKMNTILKEDKEIKRLNQANSIWQDENWQRKKHEESKIALKGQGYNDNDIDEFLAEKNRKKQEAANYFAQELAKDKSIGKYFKGSISQQNPISDHEGINRYNEYKKSTECFKPSIKKNVGIKYNNED